MNMRKTFFFIICGIFFPIIFAPTEALAVLSDQRFGYGGSPQIAKDLNIPWFYNWGVTIPIVGQKSFMLVGKIECTNPDISALIGQGIKDEDDRGRYTRLEIVLGKFEGKPLTNGLGRGDYGGANVCVKVNGARKTFLQIATTLANTYPGSYYQIANEPDWYPYFTPAEYAEYYNIFYTQIKKYDVSASVMTGGLLSIDPIIYNNPAYFGYDLNNHYKWVDDFRNLYKTRFGSFPIVDVWSIHPYSWFDWIVAKNMIIDFRDIYLTRIGEVKKPVWLTEFGILATEGGVVHPGSPCQTHGCLSATDQMLEWNIIADDFMKPLINWMKSNDYVQKWFWFYAGETSNWSGGVNYVGDTYKLPSGEYNPLGVMYKKLAEEGAEKIPNCSNLTGPNTITLGDTATYNASFFSEQGNLGKKISIGKNEAFVANMTPTAGIFTWKPTQTGVYDVFCQAWNDGIAECRGNPAYVDKLPHYECAGPKAYMTVVVSSLPGDLNTDDHVNIYDYNLLVSKFGNPYTIFDYNDLVTNYGK